MTFEEFLMNANSSLCEKLKNAYKSNEALDGSIHDMAMDYVYRYLLIGGMPEAVEVYLGKR